MREPTAAQALYPHLRHDAPTREAQEPDVSLASAMYPAISKESKAREAQDQEWERYRDRFFALCGLVRQERRG
jgi:hypothetical protein